MIYVTANIHGDMSTYKKALSYLNDGDVLYIIGNCIDYGEYGFDILLDIMYRSDIQLFMGFHELLMFESIFVDNRKMTRWFKHGGVKTYEGYYGYIVEHSEFDYDLYDFFSNLLLYRKIASYGRRFLLIGDGDISKVNSLSCRYYDIDNGIENYVQYKKENKTSRKELILTNNDKFGTNVSKGVFSVGHNKFVSLEDL